MDSGVKGPDLSFPSMKKLAEAYGYPYSCAYHNGELREVIEHMLKISGPAVCEVFVSIEQVFEPKSSAKRLPDGTIVSPPSKIYLRFFRRRR